MEMTKDLTLGVLLGRRQAFSAMAARSAAAEAAQIKEMRDSRGYLDHFATWGECCTEFLQMSVDSANRLIHALEEFGPTYFEVAQLTRISAETYRAIAPAIQDKTLNYNGEAIALIPENAEKVGAAIREIRKTMAVKRPKTSPPPPPEAEDPIRAMNRRCARLAIELDTARTTHRDAVRAAILFLRMRLGDIEKLMEL